MYSHSCTQYASREPERFWQGSLIESAVLLLKVSMLSQIRGCIASQTVEYEIKVCGNGHVF
jgi:hypothetical protein